MTHAYPQGSPTTGISGSTIEDPLISLQIWSVRGADYETYEIPSEIPMVQSFSQSRSRFHHMSAEELLRIIKRRLLTTSIHKGKFLGLKGPQGLTLDPRTFVIDVPYEVEIEYLNDDIDQLLRIIQLKKEQLDHQYPSRMTDLMINRLCRDLAWTSDAIEGTTIEKAESKIFDLEPGVDNDAYQDLDDDHREYLSHYHVIKELILPLRERSNQRLDVGLMKELHRNLRLSNLRDDEYGQYRKKKVVIAGAADPGFTVWDQIPNACEKMFEELYTESFETVIDQAIWLHYTFVQIHPFRDGNGRVGRLLMNAVLVQGGLPLTSIQPGIRDLYFRSLRVVRIYRVRRSMAVSEGRVLTGLPPEMGLLKRIVSEAVLRSLDIALHGRTI
jgi:fido (protein-threonine AMPylation protein)